MQNVQRMVHAENLRKRGEMQENCGKIAGKLREIAGNCGNCNHSPQNRLTPPPVPSQGCHECILIITSLPSCRMADSSATPWRAARQVGRRPLSEVHAAALMDGWLGGPCGGGACAAEQRGAERRGWKPRRSRFVAIDRCPAPKTAPPFCRKHRAHNTRQNGMGIPVMHLLNSTPAQNQENLNVGLNDGAAQMHNEMNVFTRFGNK